MATALTVDQLQPRLAQLTVIDVRSPGEFAAGHIPGAYNIPLDQLDLAMPALASAAQHGELAVVCALGPRSSTACQRLIEAGIPAYLLDGGTNAWAQRGYPLDRQEGARVVWALDRQVRMVAGTLVVLGLLLDLIMPGARWFSAAIGAGLMIASMTNSCAMGAALNKLPYNRPRNAPTLEDTLAALHN